MDHYSLELWARERHDSKMRAAEEHTRLRGWSSEPRLVEGLAAKLRLLADRLDGRVDADEPRLERPRLRVY